MFLGEIMDLTNYAANLSANTLLENIMAVSGGSFAAHHHHQMSDSMKLFVVIFYHLILLFS